MVEVLEHSDNVGITFVARRLGLGRFYRYLQLFGFGEKTGIDLQEEVAAELRPKESWYPIDLATAGFGQGIAVTRIQMVRAMAAVANGGKLVRPYLVQKIVSPDREIEIKPQVVRRVIKPKTAQVLTEMLVAAVDNGEARAFKPEGFVIAGKTGTAQIPIAGHYDPNKTIASFIGFAPVDNPRFVMLVTFREPTASPWGSETAAPTFFKIAKELFVHYGISPGR
jgi:cell division protein FtsI/penicillin-binding protein 2